MNQSHYNDSKLLTPGEDFIYRCTLATCIIGSIVNSIVLCMGIKLYRKDTEPSHLLICSMTLADLLLTSLAEPLRILQQDLQIEFQPLCIVIESSNWIGLPASAFSLTLLNIDKFIHFYWPLHYPRFMTKCKIWVATIFCWTLCFLDVFGIYAFGWVESHPMCRPEQADPIWYFLYSTLFAIVPSVSSLCVSLYLFVLSEKMYKKEQKALSITVDSMKLSFHRLRVIRYLLGSALWTAIALLPVRIFYILDWTTNIVAHTPFMLIVSFHTLLTLNACVNPFITLFMHPQFRDEYKGWFKNRRKSSVTLGLGLTGSNNQKRDTITVDLQSKQSISPKRPKEEEDICLLSSSRV